MNVCNVLLVAQFVFDFKRIFKVVVGYSQLSDPRVIKIAKKSFFEASSVTISNF